MIDASKAITPEIKLHYCAGIKNFGDELSPYLINKITGYNVSIASSGEGGLYAIGSLLTYESLRSNCVVWGTGTLHHDDLRRIGHIFPLKRTIPRIIKRLTSPETIKAEFRAVRGPLTREAILKEGGRCPEIYGDPAIITPKFYFPKINTNYKAGLILHYSQQNAVPRDFLDGCGLRLISVERTGKEQIEKFIDEVCSCEKIFSTSLHGVIIAQTYGIPAQWVQIKGTPIHRDAHHKFTDYFLGVNLPVQKPIAVELKKENLINLSNTDLKSAYISEHIIDRLLNIFPTELL